MNKNWIKLFVAAVLEVAWVIGLAHAYNIVTWTATIAIIIVCNYMMITVAQVLPVGTVYAVFVGLGTGGAIVADIILFGEPFKLTVILLIAVLLIGVIGLKLITDIESNDVSGKGCS
ncbi:MAG: DMT family transporter [Anaerovoracaceae bacterium]|jgi:paired small multidrug resistance pump